MAVSKMIGEAIKEERARRECKQLQLSHLGQEKVQRFQKLTLIGVVPKNVITYSDLFQGRPPTLYPCQYPVFSLPHSPNLWGYPQDYQDPRDL